MSKGWVWATEGLGFRDGVFGFTDDKGKRVIGIENQTLRGPNSGKVKGIWNCIRVVDTSGVQKFLDGGNMDSEVKDWLGKGENSKCCGVQSLRGIYKFRRMGKVYGQRGETIHLFKWGPLPDTNIGLNIGGKPHIKCDSKVRIVD